MGWENYIAIVQVTLVWASALAPGHPLNGTQEKAMTKGPGLGPEGVCCAHTSHHTRKAKALEGRGAVD